MCKCENKCGCGAGVITKILLIIGGLNWGLVGVGMLMGTNLNVINLLLGKMSWLEAVIYIIVGLVALMKIFGCPCKKCKDCRNSCSSCKVETPITPVQ